MINAQKIGEQKACNCKNSKCIKLYCECFAARMPCGKSCHCVDCHNTLVNDPNRDSALPIRRLAREDSMKSQKGCACRKSGCTKKYCQCFQSGIRCREYCKCVDCQNNESMTNKRAVTLLRKNNSEISSSEPNQNLYSLYITQSQRQMDSIIAESDPLCLGSSWLEECAKSLFQQAQQGGKAKIIERMIEIIEEMQKNGQKKHNCEDYFDSMMDEQQIKRQIKQDSGSPSESQSSSSHHQGQKDQQNNHIPYNNKQINEQKMGENAQKIQQQ